MSGKEPAEYRESIRASELTIYSHVDIGDPDYWVPTNALSALLNEGLAGLSLAGLALRTRSKVVKEAVCKALGYPVPSSFKKTQPRFLGQQLDTYTQKSLNLQIWNEELSPSRRYAIIQIIGDDSVGKVRVVNGQELALLDTTGTITTKYQARLELGALKAELVSKDDTDALKPHVKDTLALDASVGPADEPSSGFLLSASSLFSRLATLVGRSFPDPGVDQERNRGAALHRLVCECLGYSRYEDKGQFPDVRHQLLEVKLQTSPTIDLGLVLPSSEEQLDITKLGAYQPRHRDTRYAVFFGETDGINVTLTQLFVTTGADFFSRFKRFGGNDTNGKIQIPLPRDFFDI